jgi:ubiquitin-protein ligase E3 C
MFPNFTGSSRKRNVNLGGHKSNNPFTSTGRLSASASGASKTVANAQVERQHRQQERDRLKASQRLQRVWRGHRVRRQVRTARRQQLDQLYSSYSPRDALSRSIQALPLLMAVYQPSAADDHQRLRRVAQDLVETDFGAFASGTIPSVRLHKLAGLLIAALERYAVSDSPCHELLGY